MFSVSDEDAIRSHIFSQEQYFSRQMKLIFF